jgi:hypothetical protein
MTSAMVNIHATATGLESGAARENKSITKAVAASALGLAVIFASIESSAVASGVGLLVAMLGIVLLVVAWHNWELGIETLLVVVVVEGAVRKWFLPALSEWVYFYKDLLMVVILIGYLGKRSKPALLIKKQLKFFYVALMAFVMYVFAVVFNPSLPHPIVGVLGVKAYCLYMPLAFLVPRMFHSKEKLIGFLKWYLIIALPVSALGAMQFIDSNPDSPLNRYAWSDEALRTAVEGGIGVAGFLDSMGNFYVRITSTFSYLSGLTVYLPVTFALLLGLISLRSVKTLPFKVRIFLYGAIASVLTTSLMTGSRGAVSQMLFAVMFFYLFTSLKDLFRRLRQAAIILTLIYISLTVFFPAAYDAFFTRAFGGEEQKSEGRVRISEAFSLPFNEAAYAGATGYGVGTTQNAVPALMSKLNLQYSGDQIEIYYESESGRVMLELGIIGYILYTLLRVGVLVTVWLVCSSIRDRESKYLATASLSALIIPLIFGGAVVVHTQNVYQWFLIGIPFALLNAEKLAQENLSRAEIVPR